jgi:hypothetical protein
MPGAGDGSSLPAGHQAAPHNVVAVAGAALFADSAAVVDFGYLRQLLWWSLYSQMQFSASDLIVNLSLLES